MANIIDTLKINGTTYYLVASGEGGSGISPTINVTSFEGGQRLTITDVKGTKAVDILNGTNGKDGEPYTLTEADKAEIVQAAAAELGPRIEVRPQTVTTEGSSKLVYFENLTNISDKSFFLLSGCADTGNFMMSRMIPVALMRNKITGYMHEGDGYVSMDVYVHENHFSVTNCSSLTCYLYVMQ